MNELGSVLLAVVSVLQMEFTLYDLTFSFWQLLKYLSLLMTVCALLTMCILPAHAISPEEMEPFTVYDEEGNVIHSDAAAPEETSSLFLTKPFESYTVTEGFCLLFLLLGFCWCVWKIIKGGLF